MNSILIGAPGSEKRTQAKLLSQALGVRSVGSGDLFRKACEERTQLGMISQTYIEYGELVPDALVVAMMLEELEAAHHEPGLVLHGFPRTLAQAQALESALEGFGQQVTLVFYLEVPRDEMLRRVIGRSICRAHRHVYSRYAHRPRVPGVCDLDGSSLYQRSDDVGEALRRRLVISFRENTGVLDFYRKRHTLMTVNGNQGIEQVHEDLLYLINSIGTGVDRKAHKGTNHV